MQQHQDLSIQSDNPIEALPSKLGKEHLLALFPRMGYQAVVGDAKSSNPSALVPLYYTHGQILLFPPCTDNPNNSQLNGIQANVRRAVGEKTDLLTTKDWLLFPIYEEWNVSFSSRKSWVLLAYGRVANQFYLLDPTGPRRASFYENNLKYLNLELQKTFNTLLFSEVKPFVASYLNLQPWSDSASSGHWVAYFIERLACGVTLEALQGLSKRKPPLLVQEVSAALLQLYASQTEDHRSEENSSPMHSTAIPSDVVSTVSEIEKQSYGQPHLDSKNDEMVHSLLSSGVSGQILAGAGVDNSQQQSYGFNLNFYSILIFSGTTSALVALFCLATATPVISATAATGVLVVGVALFVTGVLGKCGLFGGAQPPGDAVPSVQGSELNASYR